MKLAKILQIWYLNENLEINIFQSLQNHDSHRKKAKINQTCQGKLNKFENIVDNVIFFTVISVFLHST